MAGNESNRGRTDNGARQRTAAPYPRQGGRYSARCASFGNGRDGMPGNRRILSNA